MPFDAENRELDRETQKSCHVLNLRRGILLDLRLLPCISPPEGTQKHTITGSPHARARCARSVNTGIRIGRMEVRSLVPLLVSLLDYLYLGRALPGCMSCLEATVSFSASKPYSLSLCRVLRECMLVATKSHFNSKLVFSYY